MLKAAIVRTTNDILSHKLLMLRAVVTGLVAAIILGRLFVLPLMRMLLPHGLWIAEGGSFSWRHFWIVYAPLHCTHAAVGGWIVARFHRAHRAAALSTFVACGLPMVLPELYRLGHAALLQHDPRFFPVLAQTFLPVIGFLIGGFLNFPPEDHSLRVQEMRASPVTLAGERADGV